MTPCPAAAVVWRELLPCSPYSVSACLAAPRPVGQREGQRDGQLDGQGRYSGRERAGAGEASPRAGALARVYFNFTPFKRKAIPGIQEVASGARREDLTHPPATLRVPERPGPAAPAGRSPARVSRHPDPRAHAPTAATPTQLSAPP